MNSDSDGVQVIETKILNDKEWIESLDPKERQDFESNLVSFEELEDKKVVCTSCFTQGNHKQKGFFVRHPHLGVPICKSCKNYYFEGKWTKDDEGKFEHCGWCAQGGELVVCDDDECPNAFCTKCIKRNLGRKVVTKIEECDNWLCFECKPDQLIELRTLFYSIIKFWQAVDDKNAKKASARAKREKAKSRSDCVTRSLSDASDCANLEKLTLQSISKNWAQVSDSDHSDPEVKFKAAKNFASFLAQRQKNLNQLKKRFFDHVDKEFCFEPSQRDSLEQTADDLETLSSGDFAELSLKKEKAKLEVLASSDEDSSKPSTSTKKGTTNGNSNIQEDDDLDSDSNHEIDSSNDESSPKKITAQKGKSSKSSSSKRESVKIKLFGKKKSASKSESSAAEESEQEETEEQPKKKTKKLSKSEQLFRNQNKFEEKDSDSKGTDSIKNEVTESQDNDEEEESKPGPKSKNSNSKEVVESAEEDQCDIEATSNDVKKEVLESTDDERQEIEKTPGPKSKSESPQKKSKDNKSSAAEKSSPKKADPKSEKSESPAGAEKKSKVDDVKKQVLETTDDDSEVELSSSKKSGQNKSNKSEASPKKKEKAVIFKVEEEEIEITDEDESDTVEDSTPKKSRQKSNTEGNKSRSSVSKKSNKSKKTTSRSKDSEDEDLSEDSGDSSDDESPEEIKLKKKFDSLIKQIDIKNDQKLKEPSTCQIILEKLTQEEEEELAEKGFKLLDQKDQKPKTQSKRKGGPKFDSEIDRLCNLGALKKLNKRYNRSKSSKNKKSSKMKNGKGKEDIEIELSSDSDNNSQSKRRSMRSGPDSKDIAKEAVLATSDEDGSDIEFDGDSKKKTKNGNAAAKKTNSKSSKSSKRKGSDPDFMRVKLDLTDSEEEEEKRAKKRKEKAKKSAKGEDDSSDSDIGRTNKRPRRARKPTIKSKNSDDEDDSDIEEINSDDDDDSENEKNDSDSDIEVSKKKVSKNKKKRKKKSDSSSLEDSDEERRPKKKRKRIKKNANSSDEEDEKEDDDKEEKESPTKGGRKDIRKMIKEKKLSKGTREAAEEERERRKRMDERQALYNEMCEIKENEEIKQVALDIDPKTKEVLVEVHTSLVKHLKPHQARGIRFMWEAVFESKKDVENDVFPGGAILAHCMGLGKTLQTIGLVHTVMTNFPEKIKCVLVIAPVNVVKNWVDEFNKWLIDDMEDDIDVVELTGAKDNWDRADRLRYWKRKGGALVIGYDMYRNLTNETTKKFKGAQKKVFQETLVDPGPDLVVCDEGHILKNTKSAINIAMNKVKTKRRIVLTGTPIQNNLAEYFAMVDFVKPKLLGTYNEFRNRFVNPINNGQSSDSTDRDVRIMKKRSFILSDLLKGCMQRLDYNVLVPYLQPKFEFVLCICLTDFQKKLYSHYLENFAKAGQIGSEGKMEGGKKGGLFYDVTNLSRVWNHPYILLKAKEKADIAAMFKDDAEEEEKFINDQTDEESEAKSTSDEGSASDVSEVEEYKKRKVATRNTRNGNDQLSAGLDEAKADALAANKGWWSQFLKDPEDEENELLNVELGSKMILLMDILKESYLIGDKVLVFSQSLLSLDLIETFLKYSESVDSEDPMEQINWTWHQGKDYYRMDGSTPPDQRKKWCNYFNNKKHTDMRLFLISTKAGGLGINLVAANRVIIFDASWNPAHDVQSIFRVYRFGQDKPVYIYRFLAKGTMEEKIYDRQVTKQSLSARVVDEQQIERHFTMNELVELYTFNDEPKENQPTIKPPKDKLLAELILKHKELIWKIHDHDSLLENQVDEHLTEEERKAAWKEYEDEKKGIINMTSNVNLNMGVVMNNVDPLMIKNQYRMQYPHLTEDQLNQATRAYMMQIQSGFTGNTAAYDKSYYQQEMARAKMASQQMYPGVYSQARGAREAPRVSGSDLSNAANQLQQYQKLLQIQRAHAELKRQQQQQQQQQAAAKLVTLQASAGGARPNIIRKPFVPKPKPKSNPKAAVSIVTLDDEDDDDEDDDEVVISGDDSDDGEIVLDGAPQMEDYDDQAPSTSSKRRGRPRLDPETDPV